MQEEYSQPAEAGSESTDPADISVPGRIHTKPSFLHSRWLCAGVAGLLMAVISAGVSVLVVQSSQRDTVVFDMKGTIDAFKQQTAQTALSREAADTLTQRFSTALNSSLSGWQEKHDSVIMVKGAVVSGGTDITPVIQADIARQMQGAP
ncbi:MAG: type-F conjugative transfer system protein TrbI [Pantoea sp.]|uniref:type-F conjugative transfer system protein TrbI n=1 Tax=Pantoea sp. TaxID=69393 RepID=UPI00239B47AC|nr:type-F conjugative transfer system protein TrbI [Pantoea sp.]MDE1188831.1 type-F conjugative transfer system protein TrbI [Pantoea sp.]